MLRAIMILSEMSKVIQRMSTYKKIDIRWVSDKIILTPKLESQIFKWREKYQISIFMLVFVFHSQFFLTTSGEESITLNRNVVQLFIFFYDLDVMCQVETKIT